MRPIFRQYIVRPVFALSAALLAIHPAALGASLNWKTASDGLASNAAKWNPTQVPTGSDNVRFALTGNYSVTWDRDVVESNAHIYDAGHVDVIGKSKHAVHDRFVVGEANNSVASTIVDGGSWTIENALIVAKPASAQAELTLTGENALLRFSKADASAIFGAAGTAKMNVERGAELHSLGGIIFGDQEECQVLGFIDGAGANDKVPSTLSIDSNSSEELIIGRDGDASVSVTSGALMTAPRIRIGQHETSDSLLSLAGDGATVHAESIHIGESGSKLTPGGVARLLVGSEAQVTADEAIIVGDLQGGGATLQTHGSARVDCKSLDLRNGTLVIGGGVVRVNNGSFFAPKVDTMTIDGDASAVGALTLSNVGDVAMNMELVIGAEHRAALSCFDATTLDINVPSGGVVMLGDTSDASGVLIASGDDATMTVGGPNARLIVGHEGEGDVVVDSGGHMTVPKVFAATNPGSFAVIEAIENSVLEVSDVMTLGRFDGASTGLLYIDSGGAVTVVGTNTSTLLPGFEMQMINGELTLAGILEIYESVEMTNSVITAPVIAIVSAQAHMTGEVHGRFRLKAANLIVEQGDLAVGDAGAADGFVRNESSGIVVTNGRLTILDADGASLGGTTLDDAVLAAENGLTLDASRSIGLTGPATIDADLLNLGTIKFNGFTLHMSGNLSDDGQGVSGGRLELGDGASYTGDGLLDVSQFVALAGSHVTPNGDLTIGRTTNSFLVFTGDLNVGDHTVTLRDADSVDLFGNMTLAGGTLNCKAELDQAAQSTVSGRGIVVSNDWNCAGTIAPDGDPIGRIDIGGSLNLLDGAAVELDLIDTDDGEFEQVTVANTAALNDVGTLRVHFLEYVPQPGDSFVLMQFDSRVGKFAQFETDIVGPLRPTLRYGGTRLTLEFAAAGDTNCDGSMDFNDIDPFVQMLADPDGYSESFPSCGVATGDVNGDGSTDFNDIDTFVECLINGGC